MIATIRVPASAAIQAHLALSLLVVSVNEAPGGYLLIQVDTRKAIPAEVMKEAEALGLDRFFYVSSESLRIMNYLWIALLTFIVGFFIYMWVNQDPVQVLVEK